MKQPDGSYATQDELFIEAGPEEIYRVLVDFNNRHLWWEGNRAKLLNGEEPREGSYVTVHTRQWIFPIRFLMRIQMLEIPRLIRLEVERGPIRGFCEWHVEPREKGAIVRLVWRNVYPSGLPAKWTFAVSGDRKHSQHAVAGLAGLKAYLSSDRFQKRTA